MGARSLGAVRARNGSGSQNAETGHAPGRYRRGDDRGSGAEPDRGRAPGGTGTRPAGARDPRAACDACGGSRTGGNRTGGSDAGRHPRLRRPGCRRRSSLHPQVVLGGRARAAAPGVRHRGSEPALPLGLASRCGDHLRHLAGPGARASRRLASRGGPFGAAGGGKLGSAGAPARLGRAGRVPAVGGARGYVARLARLDGRPSLQAHALGCPARRVQVQSWGER